MRTWRVGTLTMGATLSIAGLGLLYAQLNEKLVLDWGIQWWPLVFIFLGIEVLWQSYQAKKTSTRVSYDILSVFIIGILLCFGLTLQALSEAGVMEQGKMMLIAQNFKLQETASPIPVDTGLKEVVIEQSANPLEIISRPTDNITASFKAEVTAPSRNDAMQLLQQNQDLETRREGDTLYIAFTSSSPVSHMSAGIISQNNTLYLPEQLKVSIYSGVSDIKIHTKSILNDWYISGIQSVSLDLPATNNLQLAAQVNSPGDLQGNAGWEIEERTPASGQEYQETSRVDGNLNIGTGKYKMIINSNGPVSVDLLP